MIVRDEDDSFDRLTTLLKDWKSEKTQEEPVVRDLASREVDVVHEHNTSLFCGHDFGPEVRPLRHNIIDEMLPSEDGIVIADQGQCVQGPLLSPGALNRTRQFVRQTDIKCDVICALW